MPSQSRLSLPYGVCRTFFVNSSERKKARPKRRACFLGYVGGGKDKKTKRFLIDQLGEEEALKLAIEWRAKRAPLDQRTCDLKPKPRKPANSLLRRTRLRLGLTVPAAAQLLGVAVKTWAAWEAKGDSVRDIASKVAHLHEASLQPQGYPKRTRRAA